MRGKRLVGAAGAIVVSALGAWAWGQAPAGHHTHPPGTPPPEHPPAPVRITMDALHRHGGVPPGWRFAFPAGDPTAGREVFAKLECYKCHTISGERVPDTPKQADEAGPELTGMGSRHPAEYLAESILSPNAVIVEGPGYTGPDGLSIMPDYRESLTVSELIDLVAYLKSLTTGPAPGHAHAGPGAREQVVSEYRVRVEYEDATGGGPRAGRHAGHGPARRLPGHLMVFVTDVQTGDPVPYLPVRATLRAGARTLARLPLGPMMGSQGFHYGGDVRIPDQTTRLGISMGTPALRVMVAGRFAQPREVTFDWGPDGDGHTHGGAGPATGH